MRLDPLHAHKGGVSCIHAALAAEVDACQLHLLNLECFAMIRSLNFNVGLD
jgi:hypothetical protein